MRHTSRTAATAATAAVAALAFSGLFAAPASAAPAPAPSAVQVQALATGGYLDCDLYTAYASGTGYTPGQAIVVSHFGNGAVPDTKLVVRADGTWRTPTMHWSGWDYRVEVHDTQGKLLANEVIGQCGIWG